MASFTTDGMDDIFKQMEELGELTGETADEMLLAGAEIVKRKWQDSAHKRAMHSEHGFIESVGYPRKPKTGRDGKSIEIYPQGNHPDGKRNATIAFMLNYSKHTARFNGWIDEAELASETPVEAEFERIWNARLDKLGGN